AQEPPIVAFLLRLEGCVGGVMAPLQGAVVPDVRQRGEHALRVGRVGIDVAVAVVSGEAAVHTAQSKVGRHRHGDHAEVVVPARLRAATRQAPWSAESSSYSSTTSARWPGV